MTAPVSSGFGREFARRRLVDALHDVYLDEEGGRFLTWIVERSEAEADVDAVNGLAAVVEAARARGEDR